MSPSLYQRRKSSAEFTAGISSKTIYGCFESILKSHLVTGAVLDWGAGRGLLTHRVLQLQRFDSITAIDIQSRPDSLDSSVIWVQADLNEPVSFRNETFDVILSAEVIEHLENPRALAREWFRLLKPGGLLVFSTPNNESWRSILALIIRGHFISFGDSSYPAHITALVRKDISRLLQEAGFIDTRLLFTNFGVIPKLSKYYWQDIPLTSLRGLRFSDNLLAIAYKPKV